MSATTTNSRPKLSYRVIDDIDPLRDEYRRDLDSEIPDDAMVVAIEQDGEMIGYTVVEPLLHTLWWVAPKHRKQKGRVAIKALINYLLWQIKGRSVIVISDTKRKSSILKRLGFRKIDGEVYRLDL